MAFGAGRTGTRSRWVVLATLAGLVIGAAPARAQEQAPSRPMWVELYLGGGTLHRTVYDSADNPGHLAVGAGAGEFLTQHLLVGLQGGVQLALGGAAETPGGLNFSLMGVAKLYPSKMTGFYLRAGGGMLVMKDETFTSESDERALIGAVWEAGLGFDVKLAGDARLGPFVTYRRSFASGLRERSLTIGLAWMGL